MQIRFATPADTPLLRDLSEVTFRDTYSEYNTAENMEKHLQTHFTIEQISNELKEPNIRYVVIENESSLIAFAKLVLNHKVKGLESEHAAEIERLYVRKEFHGLKAGSKMIDFCTEWAKAEGFSIIWLGVWENNHNALRFYEKMGFTRFGKHDFILGEEIQTDYLMKKLL